jgi:MFS family permease
MASAWQRWNQRKTVLILAVCMAMQTTGFVLIVPLFALRFYELGAGPDALGRSIMAGAITGVMAAPLVGSLADRYGRRLLVILALAAYGLSFVGFLFAASPLALILLRAAAGALSISMIPSVIGIIAEIAPADRRAQWIGYIGGGTSAGWIAGPILGGLLYDQWGYGTAIAGSIFMAVGAFLIAVLTLPETRKRTPHVEKANMSRKTEMNWMWSKQPDMKLTWQSFRFALSNSLPLFVAMLLTYFLMMFAWTFIEPSFMFYVYEDLGWSSLMLGLTMSTYGIALMLGEIALGHLSDRLGRRPLIVLGAILFSAQFFGLAFFRSYLWLSLSFVIAGLGNALYDPALSASILDISPQEHQARIQGIRSAIGSVGAIFGSALAILAASFPNTQIIFLGGAGAALLAASVGLFVKIRK